MRSFSDPRARRRRQLALALLTLGMFSAGAWRACPLRRAAPPAAPAHAHTQAPPAHDDALPLVAPSGRPLLPPARPPQAAPALASAEEDVPDPDTGIAVRVVDGAGQPVAGYLLTVWSPDRAVSRHGPSFEADVSAPSGRFVVEMPAGTWRVNVTAEGFRPGAGVEIVVAEGRVVDARVEVEPSIAVVGVVTDALTKKPIAGAEVALSGTHAVPPVLTGDDGAFTLPSVMEESLSLTVSAEGYLTLNVGGVNGARSRNERVDVQLTPARPGVTSEVVGVGAVVAGDRDGVKITEVVSGGPAVGLLEAGDVILEVDGEPLKGKRLREGIAAIRGAIGSSARLLVKKPDGSTRTVDVDRARVALPEG